MPAILIAVAVGAAVGLAGAWSLSWSWRREWTEPSALRLGVLALPVMTYVLAVAFGGNGFVAAFIAGVVFAVRARELPDECLQLTEDTGTLLSMCVWFLFGAAVNGRARYGHLAGRDPIRRRGADHRPDRAGDARPARH